MHTTSPQGNSTLLRIYAYYRFGLSGLLLLMFYLGVAPNVLGNMEPSLFLYTSLGFAGLSSASLLLLWYRNFNLNIEQRFFLLFIDIMLLVLLIHASGGLDSGLSPLLFVTIATGSIILKPQASAALAATATLLMLAQTLLIIRLGYGDSRTLFSAGMLGSMLFICSLSFSYFTTRLRLSAEKAAAQEAHVNHLQKLAQLIIERMQTGIIVSSASGEVELINQSANQLLNWQQRHNGTRRLDDIPELEEHIRLWQTFPNSRAPNLKIGENNTEVRLRFANLEFPANESGRDAETLIYVEDTRTLNREAQQLKLASLGRLTASIAHEIRNPLGSISHAAQLLAESPDLGAADLRLTEIIETNTRRVNQIIENVLQLSRRQPTKPEALDLATWLPQFVADYSEHRAEEIKIDLRLLNDSIRTRIDSSHLAQVLTNLVDNGLRYSEKVSGEARVTLRAGLDPVTEWAYLEVIDEGDGIPEDNLAHVFEPFFTTEATGSGLGLYLSRELCESNHATLNYRRDAGQKSCFKIEFAHPDRIF